MNRFSALPIAHHILKNRLVVAPMASQTSTLDGKVTDKTLRHYANLAQSQAALVMVEYSFVAFSGRSEPNQLGVHDDDCIDGIKAIAKAIHQTDAKAGLQLTHCGGKAQLDVCPDLMAPSGITVPAYDRILPTPKMMTLNDIAVLKKQFVDAAKRVELAGFDFVELHCAHGYGLNQFLSPLTNQRDDQYGGSQLNRARLIVEIIEQIKQHTQLSIMVRVPGQDLYPQGLTQTQIVESCQYFIDAGVVILDVSSGIGGWNRPKERRGEGFLVEEAAFLKQAGLQACIIGVGGIETAEYIDMAIENQWLDLAAVGRAILKGPQEFAHSVMREASEVVV
ncbi:NADH:flavin oxidoreductase [Shewanella sp. HL-SH4]|uniref:NADH:flavin oxidoreductase n=1 Tax=Shewanella sp. HL-SH4 TaxID=3436240 RepID=UPI003EBB424A